MNKEVIRALTEDACASIRYRTRKEILGENPDINDYLNEILDDKRVKYVFTWQKPDGYLGQSFHGGWIPDAKLKFYNTGAEAALRFLSEMGVPKDHPIVAKGLNALLKDNWNPDPWKWADVYQPEIGLYGYYNMRAAVFAYYGIEEHDFIQTEIQRAVEIVKRVTQIKSLKDITSTYQKKLYYNRGISLPDIYYIRLLAFTQGWRTDENIGVIAKALNHLLGLAPFAQIYVKSGSQLIAPAGLTLADPKKHLKDFHPLELFDWMRTKEYYARMGVVKQLPVLVDQYNELKEMLEANGGFFPFRPATSVFEKWNPYAGLALEGTWGKDRWKYDMTFRSLLLLKYAGMV